MRLGHCFIKNITVYLIIGLILMMTASPAYSQVETPNETIQVIGKSTKSGQDPTTAREAAIANGLNAAVGRTILEIIPSDLLASRFDGLTVLIDQQAETFIREYKVLAEKQTDTGYQVLIQAVVVRSRLKDAVDQAGLLAQEVPMPVLLFLVTEQNVGETAHRFWWHADGPWEALFTEEALAREMRSKGYQIADHATPVDEEYNAINLNAATAADIGRLYHSDVVITGEAVASMAKDTKVTDLKTYKGTLTVRAYRTDTGAQIAISHASTVSVNTEDTTGGKSVFSLLAKEVAEDLARQIAFHQQRPDETIPAPITIEVSGTDHLRSFVALRRALNTMPDVERMQIEALTPPTAILVVHFRGSAQEMAENLKRLKTETLNIQIDETSIDRVKVILSP
ncbi:MAG: hypothetical protein U9Q05_03215 [Thermodesulfobacteriota bacterium]|nr:hypothetical protein [Thermodesulfobacteriota bacterium]